MCQIAPARVPARHGLPLRFATMLLLLLAPATALAATDHDLWYIVEMAGQRSGTMHSAQRTQGERITTASTMRIQVRRGTVSLEIAVETEFVETLDGRPVSMRSTQALGTTPTTSEYLFGDEGVTVTTRQGEGHPTVTTAALPEGAWLTPAAAKVYTRKRLEAGAAEITARVIEPSQGLTPIVSTRRVVERTTVETLGKVVPAIKTTVTMSAMPGIETTEYLDERGVVIRSSSNLGGIPLSIIAADREPAAAELDPPELMQRTFVTPDRRIPHPRRARSASYLLRVPDDAGALEGLPRTSTQRTEPVEPGALRVVVNLDAPAPAPEGDAADVAYLASSAMLSTGDAEIIALVERSVARAGEVKAERAEAMRRFVHRFIRAKNLGVGFASASEVARTREGDCTEHATLLAAMLRIDGIPSRVVSGLVYADAFAGSEHIFGYHMWTQALLEIDGRPTWVDLDATLGPDTAYDATHIALGVSALGDDEPVNPLVSLVRLLGRLQIEVERVE